MLDQRLCLEEGMMKLKEAVCFKVVQRVSWDWRVQAVEFLVNCSGEWDLAKGLTGAKD